MPLLRASLQNLRLIALAAIAIGCVGCSHDSPEVCAAEPVMVACVLPTAVRVQVVSAVTGAAVDSVSMKTTGGSVGGGPCSGNVCIVFGGAGMYEITISAPGYQSASLEVVVHGAMARACGCETVTTEQRTLALVPVPPPG